MDREDTDGPFVRYRFEFAPEVGQGPVEAGGVEGVDEVVRAGQGVEAVVQLVGVEDAEVQDFVVFED
ncbi:MAG: hypothetical protein J4F98_07930 [Acidobacteria bacterium]|nr:hypothetical protein [Acidobacteriota bacterium]